MLGDVIQQSFDPATVVDPLADRVVKSPGDIGANRLSPLSGVEIESRMLLTPLAAAVGLAAGAVLKDQCPAEKGFIGEELSGPGACVSFLAGAVSS